MRPTARQHFRNTDGRTGMGSPLRRGGRRRGWPLIDVAAGLGLAAAAVAGVIAVGVAVEGSVSDTATQSARASWARTEAATMSRNPSTVPAGEGVTADAVIGQDTVKVHRWREDLTGISRLNVAVPIADGADCTDPDIRELSCFTASASVANADPGIVTAPIGADFSPAQITDGSGATVSQGTLTVFTSPDVGETRYVVKLDHASGVGEIQFVVDGNILEAVLYDETDDTYFYGSVFAPAGADIEVRITGSETHLSRFTLYEGAR
ncbi:hypothetical protein ACFVAJ_18070 [Agromyces sp. NPDC057679]|uniref:hypothetical protein n=1 Tax=Agromyces sp. NPDC057679 TaxID=3346207 RepID=UPI00366EEE5A